MDNSITILLHATMIVGKTTEQALASLLTFLEEMENIGRGPTEQWERTQALEDETFRKHLT